MDTLGRSDFTRGNEEEEMHVSAVHNGAFAAGRAIPRGSRARATGGAVWASGLATTFPAARSTPRGFSRASPQASKVAGLIRSEVTRSWTSRRSGGSASSSPRASISYVPGLGALVETTYGKGNWVYVGLGLWRQLPAGTDGAYQLLANLISLSKAPPARPAASPAIRRTR